jgi:RNA polymerase sigma factor (sigma-70 family)
VSVPEDRALLEAWQQGDARAGHELARRHMPLVYRFFVNKVARADIDDLAQRTLMGCVDRREHIESTSFRAYLVGIARNQLLMHLRKLHRSPTDLAEITVQQLLDDKSMGAMAEARQEQRVLLLALRRLPLDLQLSVELFYWEGASLAELAEITAVPLGTVKSRLARAKQMLRKHVEELSASTDTDAAGDFDAWVRSMRRQHDAS